MNPRLRARNTTGWLGAAAIAVALTGCASTPAGDPIALEPIAPSAQRALGVSDVLYVLDASGSAGGGLAAERRLLVSLASGMPEGEYGAGLLLFGGGELQREEIEAFERVALVSEIASLERLGGDTRLASALDEAGRMLPAEEGRRAVILISDGVAKSDSRREGRAGVLDAADRLIASQPGELCLHTVQMGDHPAGASLLRELAAKSPCGSFRRAGELETAQALQDFERSVFLVAATPQPLPDVAARPVPRDTDRDGVEDARDRCSDTPFGVLVDADGCWNAPAPRFDTNSSLLTDAAKQELSALSEVLERNPDIAIRVVGHADATGEPRYNQWLAERRANRVRSYLVEAGVSGSRIAVEAVGDTAPIGANDSDAGRASNRRAEIVLER